MVCSAIYWDRLEEQYTLNAGIKSRLGARVFTEKAHILFDVA